MIALFVVAFIFWCIVSGYVAGSGGPVAGALIITINGFIGWHLGAYIQTLL